MTELSNVLKTYQDNALKTLQGPASLFYNTHQYHKGLKREIDDSPPPPSSDDDYKHVSPSPMQCNISIPSGTVIERTETNRQISSPSSPPQQQQQNQQQQQQQQQQNLNQSREYCQSPQVTFVPMMQQPIQSQPILTAPDSECGELMECILEGCPIGCFQLGGELRLCFPQIINKILPDFPLDRIHRTIDDLHISFLQSTPEQLVEFKHAKILPPNVPPCGLITRTNAERLCSALLHKAVKKNKDLNHQNYFSFRVYHRCFGKCEGICTPELFTFRDRECIECVECHGMLAPNKFVLHVCKNKPKENFTCHWGFESNKWRSYIHVAMSEPNQEKCTRLLDDMFALECDFERVLYEHSQMEDSNHSLKRKAGLEDVSQTKQESGYDIPLKKTKMDETQMTHYLRELYPATLLYQFSQLSRQQPWLAATSPKHIISPFGTSIPYLTSSQEPPILQNPERVVRHTENERFDRSYQPNVALAPRQTILAKEREREQRDYEKERETNERSSSVIKRETIQIKQERPSTPNAHELSSDMLRHNSPETTVVLEDKSPSSVTTAQPPISPEGQSGSNEITSSTSPVPATTPSLMIPNKQESISPPHHLLHHNNNNNHLHHHSTSPRSHHNHHSSMINSHHHHLIHHKKSLSTSSISPPTVVVKMTTNHSTTMTSSTTTQMNGLKKVPIIGNPEFELSTDTDDESLGEPDSSNHIGSLAQTPSDFVAILLKNNSLDDHKKILDLVKYMEKDIAQSKESHKKDMRELQSIIDSLRKENEHLQNQLNQQHKMSVIANAASCLSSSSSSSSSSLSSNSSYDFEQARSNNNNNVSERRNSIVAAATTIEKPNVIIKPPKKSLLRITPLLDNDCKPTANNNNNISSNNNNNLNLNNNSQSTMTPSIVIMPKCEDIINNNNTKIFNNNQTTTTSSSSTTTNGVMNGQQQQQQQQQQQTESSTTSISTTDIDTKMLQKTAIKAEKL